MLEHIQNLNALIIRQRRELAELIGFETRNKYAIQDERGQDLGFAAEQGKGILGLLFRGILGHWRTFHILIFDEQRQAQLRIDHPFRWYFQRMEVSHVNGGYLGALEKRFSILSKKFTLYGPQNQVVMEVNSPIWRFWTFIFIRQNSEMGRVEKRWSGFFKEAFTDGDNFKVTFKSQSLSKDERVLMLCASFFIDILYFERKARS